MTSRGPGSFRVATFNLYQAYGGWESRRELIVQQLLELQADVLCLNEVSIPVESGRWIWQRAHAEGLDYRYLQQTKTGALSIVEGQGILTRLPVLEGGFLDFRSRDRIAQVARLDVDSSSVDVYLTHLHHVRGEPGLREFQAQQLLAWIDSRDPPDARLVCGDFNSPPGTPATELMQSHFTPTQLRPTFPTPLRYSAWTAENVNEGPEETFTVCLDYIWYQASLRLLRQGQCFNRASPEDETLWPSDHVGLWADFEVSARPARIT